MAQHILKHKLQQKGITSKEVEVLSAGLAVNANDVISQKSVAALKTLGIVASKKQTAKQLTKEMVSDQTIIITMTKQHKMWLNNLPHVYALSEFDGGMDLDDVYGYPQEAYTKAANLLNFMLDEVVEKLLANQL